MKPIERLYKYFEYKRIAPTALEKKIGLSNGYFGKTYSRLANMNSDIIKKIIDFCPDINLEWLILGIGNMLRSEEDIKNIEKQRELFRERIKKTKNEKNVMVSSHEKKTKNVQNVMVPNHDKNHDIFKKNKKCTKCPPLESPETPENTNHVDKPHLKFQLRTDHNLEIQHIPLYNIEAVAGLIPLFTGNVYHTDEYIQIPNLPRCDGAIHITGDSMYPLLKSGDIVLYKQINDIANNIFYGEMYLISIDMEGDEYITVKYIQKSEKEGHIILVSYNKAHSDKEIHINSIKALAFVKASIRINAMV